MRRRELLRLLGSFAMLSGCSRQVPRLPAQPSGSAPQPRSRPRESRADEGVRLAGAPPDWLSRQAVLDDHFWLRSVFSWTTAEQEQELRSGGRLLSRSRARDGSRAFFDVRVQKHGGPMARLLALDQLSLRRFAWPNAWATRLSWPGESYGDRLLFIELQPDAIVARLDADANWSFAELDGRLVSLSQLLHAPERLAAVYHVWSGHRPGHDAGPASPLREYVLVNESKLRLWELGTKTVMAELERGRRVAALLQDALTSAAHGLDPELVRSVWSGARPADDLLTQYVAALAFTHAAYDPRRGPNRPRDPELLQALEAVPTVQPLSRPVSVRFLDQKPPPPPKRPPKRPCIGTLC